MAAVAEEAATDLRDRGVSDLLTTMISAPSTQREIALQRRFQQVTGALLAKSHEDTAGFRWTPYLAACEVGADPDVPAATPAQVTDWANAQPGTGLLLTSSHDTKRSEDARMRLVAMSHLSGHALTLIEAASHLTSVDAVPAGLQWYIVQSALAIWDGDDPDLRQRLADHTLKAMREADEVTSWTHPIPEPEDAALAFLDALIADWKSHAPVAVSDLIEMGNRLSLAQLALKMMLPGIPDIYRGCEGAHFALTDPDNRMPVDAQALEQLNSEAGLGGAKARLTRQMLGLHHTHSTLFRVGHTAVTRPSPTTLCVTRAHDAQTLRTTIALSGSLKEAGERVVTSGLDDEIFVAVEFHNAQAIA